MTVAQIVQYDPERHREHVTQMYIEHIYEVAEQLKQNYNIDALATVDEPFLEYVEKQIQPFINLTPPSGNLIILEISKKAEGMGVIIKLRKSVGEIRRMYIRPKHRGKGYGKKILNALLDMGRDYGVSNFYLSTYHFMDVAKHLYMAAGFKETEPYPESISYQQMWKYLTFMEKKENNR